MEALRVSRFILPALFAVSVFSLIWRYGNISVTGKPKIFEILILATFVIAVFDALYYRGRKVLTKLRPVWRLYGLLFGMLCLFVVMGYISSVFRFPESIISGRETYIEFLRLAFSLLLFFLTIYIVSARKGAINFLLGAIATSPLILLVAFSARLKSFFTDNARLIGAQNDPNYLATFIALSIIIALTFFLYKKGNFRWLGPACISLVLPLFIWTQSRAAFLSIAAAILLLFVAYLIHGHSERRIYSVATITALLIVSVFISFNVLPKESQFYIYRRSIYPVVSNENIRSVIVEYISSGNSEIRDSLLGISRADNFSISRGGLWKMALIKIVHSPLGLGPAYHIWAPLSKAGRPHNLFFEVGLTSGWGGLSVFLVFLYFVIRDAFRIMRKDDFVGMALSVSFIYLLINGLFLDMLTLRWLWLIIGMIVGYSFLKENEGQAKSIGNTSSL